MQTGKRRVSIFPFFQAGGAAIRTRSAKHADPALPSETLAASCEQRIPPVITARGKRFAIHQIGSMFGSD